MSVKSAQTTRPQAKTTVAQARLVSPQTSFVGLFTLVVCLSAFLLFSVQPMIAKYLLPTFGGTAGVWATCLAVFQLLLLAGYLLGALAMKQIGGQTGDVLGALEQGCEVLILLAAATMYGA